MLKAGPAKKVSIYVGEDHQVPRTILVFGDSEFPFLPRNLRRQRGARDCGIWSRPSPSYDADRGSHADLPIKVEFIESPEKVEEVLPKLHELAGTGLIEIQDTLVVKPAEVAKKKAPQESLPALKREGKAKLMRIFIGENDKWRDKPLHKALIESMRANDIAGVTVYQGILGYGANRRIHKDSALHLSHDRPVMLSVVDTEEKLQAYFPILDRDGPAGARCLVRCGHHQVHPQLRDSRAEKGGPAMKLAGKAKMLRIHFGEDDKWKDKPLYRAIVEKCRELDIAGATVLRGIEGYGASTLIRRSHLLSFSHDAPVMVSVIDSEDKIQKLLPFLDEVVDEGLIAMSEVEVIKYVHQDGARSK